MEDHTYASSARLTLDDEDVIIMADRTCTLLTQPDEAASGFTSKNTLSIFENLWDEDTTVYSDCDDVDKDPNYIPFINLETSINPINIADVIIETHHNTGQINQDITLRKRRMSKNEKYTQQVKMKETQNKKQIDKHPIILKTCDGKCKKQCPLLSNEHQKEIWQNFWRLNYTDRRKYLSKCVTLVPVKRRRVSANDDINFKKHKSRFYSLTHPELKVELTICKKTFLQTLGYTNDSVITELVAAVEKDSCGQYIKENRGRSRVDIIDREVIVKHIELYHPCISHYRRHNAPNIRYLPRELTLKDMFKDFSSKYPKYCDIETYRTTLKRQNVSLNQPKADDCEDCLNFVADPDDETRQQIQF